MRTLFEMDTRDYDPKGRAFVRPSVRGIILRNGTVAMVHSIKYDYYKFPGGGMEPGESRIQTLIREVQEESGLIVLPDTIREYGNVYRKQKSDRIGEYAIFIQDNYFYLCDTAFYLTYIHTPKCELYWLPRKTPPPVGGGATPATGATADLRAAVLLSQPSRAAVLFG